MENISTLFNSLIWPWFSPQNKALSTHSWVGSRPTFALWVKFILKTGIRPGKKHKVALLDYWSIKELEQESDYFDGQNICENGEEEEILLNKSMLGIFPHEVFQIKIRTSSGHIIEGPVFHGTPEKSSTYNELRKIIKQLVFKTRTEGYQIVEVELVHTHPSLEVMIISGDDHKFIFNGLSKTDCTTGQRLAEFLDYPLLLRAITPSANYCKIF